MTLLFTYQVSNVLANADYQLTNQSANVVRTGQTFRTLTSNFFEDPIEAYIISNETYLTTLQVNYQATIIITDGESNNIGSISFFNFFQKLNTKTNKSIIFAITTATGLLSGYLNGTVVIDMSRPDTHTIYLFKR
jgi:23S rRNA pseudoU1915 N3-methylase RlmH